MADSNIHAGHRERLKERFVKDGFSSFEDHQVLELLLFYSISRKDTNELAHRLLKEFGTLSGVLDATVEELQEIDGLGRNTAIFLNMLPALFKRYTRSQLEKKPVINSTISAGIYATTLFAGLPYETFFVISLNSQGEVISVRKIAEGTVDEVAAYPRKVVEAALVSKAHSIVLAHNHPGGNPCPSQEDIDATVEIKKALDLVDITINDHIVVCGSKFTSFKEKHML